MSDKVTAWIGEPDYEAAWKAALPGLDEVAEGTRALYREVVDAALASMTQTEVTEERAEWTMRATRSLRRWVSEWIEYE